MTPEEVAMTTSHPLCNRDCVATLRNIYTEADGGIVTGKISDWVGYTVGDSDPAVANGPMAVSPSATHLNCNVHHPAKGLGLGGGLRKSLVLPPTAPWVWWPSGKLAVSASNKCSQKMSKNACFQALINSFSMHVQAHFMGTNLLRC